MVNTEDAFLHFLTYCKVQKNLSSKTLKAYSIDSKQFLDFLAKYEDIKDVKDINKEVLRSFLQSLSDEYKIKTIKRKIACLKAFFNYLEFEDIIPINPFRKLKIKLKVPFNLPTVMTLSEVEALLKTVYNLIDNTSTQNTYTYKALLRDVAVLELLFATGLRVSELCTLKKNEVNIEDAYVKVSGKGEKERIVFIGNDDVKNALIAYINAFDQELKNYDYFFINRLHTRLSEQSVRFMVNKYVKAAGLKKHITPHVFRHSFATLLLEEGVDIKYIQNFLGHSSIMTTQIYTHVNKEKQKEILTRKHPRGNIRTKGDMNEG